MTHSPDFPEIVRRQQLAADRERLERLKRLEAQLRPQAHPSHKVNPRERGSYIDTERRSKQTFAVAAAVGRIASERGIPTDATVKSHWRLWRRPPPIVGWILGETYYPREETGDGHIESSTGGTLFTAEGELYSYKYWGGLSFTSGYRPPRRSVLESTSIEGVGSIVEGYETTVTRNSYAAEYIVPIDRKELAVPGCCGSYSGQYIDNSLVRFALKHEIMLPGWES